MGEGKGMQNVSDQIEHEEQLEGLKDDQGDPDEEPDKEEKKEQDDNVFDMKNDFDGKNEDDKKDEDDKDKSEIDSQDLDDEMDDVDNKLDNELFNEDNEISSESDNDNDDDDKEEEKNKPPLDLDKDVDLEHKDKEAKGNDEDKEQQKPDKEQDEQKETEMKPEEDKNDINDKNEEQDQPYINVDDAVKEDAEDEKDKEDNKSEGEQSQEGEEEKDEEMSEDGEHKFDPIMEDENGQEQSQQDEEENDFNIEDLENMDGDDKEHDGISQDEEEVKSEQMDSEENPDHSVDADREEKPDEEDTAIAAQVPLDKKQDNNSLGQKQEKGMKQEQDMEKQNQESMEQKDYNTEENDYLFQVMQQYMEHQKQEEKNKPKEGERNEDQNMKKAENVEELDNLPEQAEATEKEEDIDAKDFAKDEKSKEMRSNVADTVKYNDQDMQPEENKDPEENLAPENPEKSDEEMSDHDDKDLKVEQEEDPVKSMIKTNEFYQKYLEDKNPKEEGKENEKNEGQKDDKDVEMGNNEDANMENSEEEKEFKLKQEEYKIDEGTFDAMLFKRDLIERYDAWRKNKSLVSDSYELLNKFKKTTNHLSISLCEQMRMILEPTEKSRLRGDYKSGKRINIKKIIPFIASNYRNDKIWLRREMPFKRDYRVLIAIDDSLSMKKNNLGFFALESLVAISEALNQLNVGKVCVCGINDRMKLHMSFEDTYSAEKSAFILSNYSFEYQSFASADTSIPNFMSDCNKLLDSLKTENRNIVFIISDGRFNKKKVHPYIMEAEDKKYLYVFILLDNYSVESKNSIFNMKSAELVADQNGKTDYKITRYLEDFPFKYYTVVQEISHLPKVLSNIFLQWLAMVNS